MKQLEILFDRQTLVDRPPSIVYPTTPEMNFRLRGLNPRYDSSLRFLFDANPYGLYKFNTEGGKKEIREKERKKESKREREKKIQSGNSLFQVECDRSRHLQREEYESEELCNAVALRNILVLWRRIRVLSETPQRYVTYVHSLISSFTFIHRLESWIYVERHPAVHTVKHFPTNNVFLDLSSEITPVFD